MSEERRLISPGEAAGSAVATLAKGVGRAAYAHPKISGMWSLGLVLSLFATGFTVSREAAGTYEQGMLDADMSTSIKRARQHYSRVEAEYQASRGWFFTCDERCRTLRASSDEAGRTLSRLMRQEAEAMSDVKAGVGIFSVYGVAETRDRFWQYFAGGKDHAKRMTAYDVLFMGIRSATSRDEDMMKFIVRCVVSILFNITFGLVGALIAFTFQLYSLVASYRPDPATALAFAVCTLLAATSMVASYLFVLYFSVASGVSALVAAEHAMVRIDQERRGGRLRGQEETHHRQTHHYHAY